MDKQELVDYWVSNLGPRPRHDEASLDAVIDTVRDYLALLQRSNIAVERAYVFGSWPAGRANRHSDIDVAVVARDWLPDIVEARFTLLKAASRIDSRLEPHPFRTSEFNESDPWAREVLGTGRRVL